ncbi:hypothetical protein NDU88_001079 [Pleurodeles waltl]|uniref:Uncharacterized protein n=1 Tax=Pleurodeles waltl TaxID=8319 RepID=A0AAV7Q7I9_PLEWA|nr:hypothetical protein NDU88_001079 [Pleurodeles waltl]
MSLWNPGLPDATNLHDLKLGRICGVFAMPSRSGTHMSVPSPTHHTEVRIDLMWVPAADVMNLSLVRILPRGISDHTPLLADWGAGHQAQRPTWRLNAWYLKFPECAEFVEEELETFCCNEGLVDLRATLWAACKPSMCGIIKSYIWGQEQRQRTKFAQLEAKLLELDGQTGHLDTQAVQRQLVLLRSELRQISLEEAKQCWQVSTSGVYGMGVSQADHSTGWQPGQLYVIGRETPKWNWKRHLRPLQLTIKTYMLKTPCRVWQRRTL